MKNTAFIITYVSVATSIVCGILITVHGAVPVLPIWTLWGLLMMSTIISILVIGSFIVIGITQWVVQHINRQAFNQYAIKQGV